MLNTLNLTGDVRYMVYPMDGRHSLISECKGIRFRQGINKKLDQGESCYDDRSRDNVIFINMSFFIPDREQCQCPLYGAY